MRISTENSGLFVFPCRMSFKRRLLQRYPDRHRRIQVPMWRTTTKWHHCISISDSLGLRMLILLQTNHFLVCLKKFNQIMFLFFLTDFNCHSWHRQAGIWLFRSRGEHGQQLCCYKGVSGFGTQMYPNFGESLYSIYILSNESLANKCSHKCSLVTRDLICFCFCFSARQLYQWSLSSF